MLGFLKRMVDTNTKEVRRLTERAQAITALEPEIKKLTDDELRAKTGQFKERLARGAGLDDILDEAFAVVREAAQRTIGQRHFDVQLMGGIVLHEGRIAEMKTGEGKTLVSTLPVYLNALAGRGVHVVTVNDYLARRDSEWMGHIHKFLGLSVGCILHHLDYAQRKQAYACDITYGTNNEFGFDYLRDNMVLHPEQRVQRELYYAIVDEVDSILIDEARTPLIISGAAEESTEHYYKFAKLVPRLQRDVDYTVDEKTRQVAITEEGVEKLERWLGVNMFDETHFELTHYMQQALRAHCLYQRDRDYVVKDGQVIIVDEFTGRLMFGRRYGDGLHQAIEAKENVRIERETQTLASITFQNYFRMYRKLAGMTGTAETEEAEFRKIYGMDVVVIPTNMPMIREDLPDLVYKTEKGKFEAVVEEINRLYEEGRPVLVGTISIEKSERLSEMLKRRGVPHRVLNAKHHEMEAEIIAQAGRYKAVTIATNMAGRGTDIVLGGNPEYLAKQRLRAEGVPPEILAELTEHTRSNNPEVLTAKEKYMKYYKEIKAETDKEREKVLALGGLMIIGTERHESRRIDNQLRGRSGRQGDPGASRFYVSLEDDLMRLFGSQRIAGLMDRLGWQDDQPIEHKRITKSIETAQRKVESYYFDIREQVLKYDDVLNKQREVVYELRRKVLMGEDVHQRVLEMLGDVVKKLVQKFCPEKVHADEWDLSGLVESFHELIAADTGLTAADLAEADRTQVQEILTGKARSAYEARETTLGAEHLRELERLVILHFIDLRWMDHLRNMDDLREGIGLRAYAQKDPLLEYQFEGFQMFQAMMDSLYEGVLRYLFRVQITQDGKDKSAGGRRAVLGGSRAGRHPLAAQTNRSGDGSGSGGGFAAGGMAGTGTMAGAGGMAGSPGGAGSGGGGVNQPRRAPAKVGRNDPCPCGSGKKYKKCCGAN
ncbi:MAG TPA: preprotein translocase subunit SecA [Firmicutes bacterium]|nr:preprotein translocase subunit SecA [Bacillota bacterium]